MRAPTFALMLLIPGCLLPAPTHADPFHAGIARITVSADKAFEILVWYPTQAEEVPWQEGPFPIPASRDAAIAPGRFPVVLLSHGGGAGGGTPLVLRELTAYLARQGFLAPSPSDSRCSRQPAFATRTISTRPAR